MDMIHDAAVQLRPQPFHWTQMALMAPWGSCFGVTLADVGPLHAPVISLVISTGASTVDVLNPEVLTQYFEHPRWKLKAFFWESANLSNNMFFHFHFHGKSTFFFPQIHRASVFSRRDSKLGDSQIAQLGVEFRIQHHLVRIDGEWTDREVMVFIEVSKPEKKRYIYNTHGFRTFEEFPLIFEVTISVYTGYWTT